MEERNPFEQGAEIFSFYLTRLWWPATLSVAFLFYLLWFSQVHPLYCGRLHPVDRRQLVHVEIPPSLIPFALCSLFGEERSLTVHSLDSKNQGKALAYEYEESWHTLFIRNMSRHELLVWQTRCRVVGFTQRCVIPVSDQPACLQTEAECHRDIFTIVTELVLLASSTIGGLFFFSCLALILLMLLSPLFALTGLLERAFRGREGLLLGGQ